uniref:Uncharacterized protein n=1 Tax=Arundo donax TaxID=35708 RepID=A0A0A9CRA8_ARUDO
MWPMCSLYIYSPSSLMADYLPNIPKVSNIVTVSLIVSLLSYLHVYARSPWIAS